MTAKTTRVLTRQQALDGYALCIQNVSALQHASLATAHEARATALALAQIGQEELGKSMALLCSVAFSSTDQWTEFWRRWKNHDAKAHLAHWYEWLDPLQFSLTDPEGRTFDGTPFRNRFSDEKEAGLYVDFDEAMGAFVLPAWRVPPVEAYGRLGTLGALALTAAGLYDVLYMRDSDFRIDAMAAHLLRLWSGFVPQEAMHAALISMKDTSDLHASFVADLQAKFRENRAVLRESFRSGS